MVGRGGRPSRRRNIAGALAGKTVEVDAGRSATIDPVLTLAQEWEDARMAEALARQTFAEADAALCGTGGASQAEKSGRLQAAALAERAVDEAAAACASAMRRVLDRSPTTLAHAVAILRTIAGGEDELQESTSRALARVIAFLAPS